MSARFFGAIRRACESKQQRTVFLCTLIAASDFTHVSPPLLPNMQPCRTSWSAEEHAVVNVSFGVSCPQKGTNENVPWR